MRQLNPILASAFLLGLLAACERESAPSLPEGVTLVEEAAGAPGEAVSIAYAKYELDNGLTVVLHEDASDPLVRVDVTYHVGSAREEVGKSGFAHLFEHMMFQGSTNVGDDQHFKIVSESGGTMNGSTNPDRTNYYQTVPANQLEKMLWLEADRMGFLLDAVTQEKFEVQRATVKNERAENYDNRPYGLMRERVNQALYPQGHPYSWLTIGYVEDLDRVGVADLKQFFLRWYGPNNAVLTIGGDIDRAQTLAWVSKYFGGIPRGPDVSPAPKAPGALDATRYISMEDNVALPVISINYPTVHLHHADEAPLDVLMGILGTGKTSLFYKNLVKTELAVNANAGHPCQELACAFIVSASVNPKEGRTLATVERAIRDSLAEFETRGVTDDDLERTKMSIVSGMIYNLESVAGKVTRLAFYETFTGDPGYTGTDIARYENVTKEDVLRVYRQYIKDQPALVMSVVPKGRIDQRAAEDNWQPPPRKLPEYQPVAAEALRYRPAEDGFDRSAMPPAGPNPVAKVPPIWRAQLENGVTVIGARNAETPTTAIRLRIEAGQRDEPLDKLGLAALTAAMLDEATKESTSEALSDRLQKLGASVSFSANDDHTVAAVRTLSRNLPATLAILAEKLLTPKFDAADFARRRAQLLRNIEQSRKQAEIVVTDVHNLLLLGKDNPIAYFNAGTKETMAGITLEDVEEFYAARYTPQATSVVVVSDLEQEAVMGQLAVLAAWQGEPVARAPIKPLPEVGETTIYLVDKPGAPQSRIRLGRPSLAWDATGDYYRASIANFTLGGTFNSRINLNLREDKGYTYGAGSRFAGSQDYGLFLADAGVRKDVTGAALAEFDKEIRGFAKDGVTAAELAYAKSALGQRDARAYETPQQKAAFLARILTYDLAEDFVDKQSGILAAIAAEELNALAARHMVMDAMAIVVVGDAAVVRPQLETLGYDIVLMDVDANPVAAAPGEADA